MKYKSIVFKALISLKTIGGQAPSVQPMGGDPLFWQKGVDFFKTGGALEKKFPSNF